MIAILLLLSFKGICTLQNICWWGRPKMKIQNHKSPNTWALLSCLRCSHSVRILCQGSLHPVVDVASLRSRSFLQDVTQPHSSLMTPGKWESLIYPLFTGQFWGGKMRPWLPLLFPHLFLRLTSQSPSLWIGEAWWAFLETEQNHTRIFCSPSWHPTPFWWQWHEAVRLSLFGSCR